MLASEILTKTEEILAKPENWTKRAPARNKKGTAIWSVNDDFQPVCFCLSGALKKATQNKKLFDSSEAEKAKSFLDKVTGNLQSGFVAFNDNPNTTHEMVLDAIRSAKELALKEESKNETI